MEAAVAAARAELAAAGHAADDATLRAAVLSRLITSALQRASLRRGNAERGDDPAPHAAARAAAGAPPLRTPGAAAALRAGEPLALLDNALSLDANDDNADDTTTAPHEGALRAELALLAASGRMALTAQAATATRTDRVAWLSEAEASAAGFPALAAAVCALKALVAELNAAGCVHPVGGPPLVVPARAQVALYGSSGGGDDDDSGDDIGYVPHWDNTPLAAEVDTSAAGAAGAAVAQQQRWSNRRVLTCVLYACARDWDVGRDGGALRCHVGAPPPPPGDAAGQAATKDAAQARGGPPWRHVDVALLGGRIVVFDARRLLHEVLPSRRPRLAITLWAYEPLPAQL
jgi:hypothetical protein